jgi:ribonuclease HI
LSAIKEPASIVLHSDSKYVINGITKGWARKWRANGWMRTRSEPAQNPDLWERLLDLCDKHDVQFQWVKGHAGIPGNERCDALATRAASGPNLAVDSVYEKSR